MAYQVLDAALKVMVNGPASLPAALNFAPVAANLDESLSIKELASHLRQSVQSDDPMRHRLRSSLVAWDYVENPNWGSGTTRNTKERRAAIYGKLELDDELADILDERIPIAYQEPPVVIAKEFHKWYSTERRTAHEYYWPAYRRYLEDVRDFDAVNLEVMDDATDKVVERLTDPEQPAAYQAKGLVVGYVQSGKTANFTGVIAKALDAGYRLVIVLSGTTDLLRNQTQRRIDMELVGKEQIRRHAIEDSDERLDYDDDPDWKERFISYGRLPSKQGSVDILRLTGPGSNKGSIGDYQSLKHGIQALEIEKHQKERPLFDPINLHRASARLMVVKKNATRLENLVNDLRKIGTAALSEVPALIIDDESDQASVNTIRPDRDFQEEERKRRSSINQHLVDLLDILPRAQYVGYTATPFANVFVDPDDAFNIYPKDFIVSLPRPLGYMGTFDFHDLDLDPDDLQDPAVSHEAAYVRSVRKPHDESTEQLRRAIDTFVLTGAVKIYRQKHGVKGDFRHHTMLLHESQLQAEHKELAKLVGALWDSSGYDGGDGMARLQRILSEDLLPVTRARGVELPMPENVADLRSELGEALRRIEEGGKPILTVNGTRDADTPDFDKLPIWKMVVGGAKLSRGYTVEGLTITYFRRRAKYQDTLLQMGRWFGFRPGYRDLVRLFIGRHEPLTKARRRFIDLHEAFQAICLDEDEFRRQLTQYAMPADGSPPITPLQVPPLVTNSHPQLAPVGPSKMFNATLKSRNFGGKWIERTLCSDLDADLLHNGDLFAQLCANLDLKYDNFGLQVDNKTAEAPGYAGVISHAALTSALESYIWAEPNENTLMALELQFLRGEFGDPEIEDWVIYLPQVKGSKHTSWRVGDLELASVERSRVDGFGRFKAFSEPRHRRVAEMLTNVKWAQPTSPAAIDLTRSAQRGAMVLYPVYPPREEDVVPPNRPTMGFALLPPRNSLPDRVEFGVRNAERADAAAI